MNSHLTFKNLEENIQAELISISHLSANVPYTLSDKKVIIIEHIWNLYELLKGFDEFIKQRINENLESEDNIHKDYTELERKVMRQLDSFSRMMTLSFQMMKWEECDLGELVKFSQSENVSCREYYLFNILPTVVLLKMKITERNQKEVSTEKRTINGISYSDNKVLIGKVKDEFFCFSVESKEAWMHGTGIIKKPSKTFWVERLDIENKSAEYLQQYVLNHGYNIAFMQSDIFFDNIRPKKYFEFMNKVRFGKKYDIFQKTVDEIAELWNRNMPSNTSFSNYIQQNYMGCIMEPHFDPSRIEPLLDSEIKKRKPSTFSKKAENISVRQKLEYLLGDESKPLMEQLDIAIS